MKLNGTRIGKWLFLFLTVAMAKAAQKAANPPTFEGDQARAIGCMRSINTAEVYYAKVYKKGWSPNLASLGEPPKGAQPSAEAANLIANWLTSGQAANHVFTYQPGQPDANEKINTYTLTVRPVKWHKGLWNFFTDDTGKIRGTSENRAATPNDPLL